MPASRFHKRKKVDGLLTCCPARSRIANSPAQVGAETCTRVSAFREIRGIYPLVNRKRVSLVQVCKEILGKRPPVSRKSRSS